MNIRYLLLWMMCVQISFAQTYTANPDTYTGYLSQLQPGDTLLLESGTYTEGLNIYDMEGSAEAPIVIRGMDSEAMPVFEARTCCNTVSIKGSAYITIQWLILDGLNIPDIDGVKGEGTSGNWAHDITLEHLVIRNHGAGQQQVGISTKCPAWNWTIRCCTIERAGTGMYLGNSNGQAPFVNGLIENNLVKNTIGYNIEIKHQNEGLRTLPGMVQDGKTVIRYNTFCKEENASSGDASRPNLLVGNFPATGSGMNDVYEIYGNFFYQNPSEALFQGTGNIAFYNNVCVNHKEGGTGIVIMEHNGFKPRTVDVFHNTVVVKDGYGIRFYHPDTGYTQQVIGNAVFAPVPVRNAAVEYENVTGSYDNASEYVTGLTTSLPGLSLVPVYGKLTGSNIDSSLFSTYERFDRDFDGYLYDWRFRGAYGLDSAVSRWQLNTTAYRIVSDSIATTYPSSVDAIPVVTYDLECYPNPVAEYITLRYALQNACVVTVALFNASGQQVTLPVTEYQPVGEYTRRLSLASLPPGTYWIAVESALAREVVRIEKIR